MEKKIKIILTLFLIIGMLFIPINVNAYSGELNSKIMFPMMIWGGEGTISLPSSETGYNLYYQAVNVSNDISIQMQQIEDAQKVENENSKAELNALKAEYNNLKEIRDSAKSTYLEKKEAGITGEELETYKAAYDTAEANYQNKLKEYNARVKYYNNKTEESKLKYTELIPIYNDNNWIKTSDGKFSVDLSKFTGKRRFAIWAKLVSSDGTSSYNVETYIMSGTKQEDVKVTGISLDKTTLSIEKDNSYTLVATITPSNSTNKTITWSSDNENVATVSNGKVTAKSVGTATITTTTNDGKYTATCKVTVTNKTNNTGSNDNKGDKPSNSGSNSTKGDQNKKDDTVAPGKMPQTGINMTIVFFIVASILISIIVYRKYNNYKDIK